MVYACPGYQDYYSRKCERDNLLFSPFCIRFSVPQITASMYLKFVNFGWRLKRQYAREALRVLARLSSETLTLHRLWLTG